MHFIGLLLCLVMMVSIRSLGTWIGTHEEQPTLVLALGFVLLTAFVAGRISHELRLPRATGYLLLGVLIGPGVFDLVTRDMSRGLLFINGITVSLIALSAGGELKLEWLGDRIKQILTVSILGAFIVFLLVFCAAYLMIDLLPFSTEEAPIREVIIAVFIGVFAVANSPMVVIAIITETEARGPLAQTVLGVTIIRDVMVIVLFSIVMTLADVVLEGKAISAGDLAKTMGLEIGGSIGVGVLLGWGLALCARNFWRQTPLIVMGFCFFMAHLGTEFHLDTLLMGLAAGFFVENISRRGGPELIAGVERCSLPLYCLFFGLAGISLDLGALAKLWPVALALAVIRCAGLWAGTLLGVQLTGGDQRIGHLGWLGFIANAGVLLAMATIVARTFPHWGPATQTLVMATIGINLLLGPIGFRYALIRCGEAQET